jgi:hypothetical protein
MWLERRALPERLTILVQLEPRLLEVLDDPLGKLVPSVIGRMLLQKPVQQAAATGQREADRKDEVITERPGKHAGNSCSCFVL